MEAGPEGADESVTRRNHADAGNPGSPDRGQAPSEIARSLGQSMTEFREAMSDTHVAGQGTDSATAALPAARSTTAVARACSACTTALEPDWAYCPRCGTPAPSGS